MLQNDSQSNQEFIKLYKEYSSKIYNYIARSFLNKEEAEDVTANTFLKALNYFKNNKPAIENVNAWLYKIAANEISTRHRYIKSKKDYNRNDLESFDILTADNEHHLDKHLEFLTIKKALEHLKPVEKHFAELYYFEQLDYRTISEILDIKEVTLRSMNNRLLKKLKKIIGS